MTPVITIIFGLLIFYFILLKSNNTNSDENKEMKETCCGKYDEKILILPEGTTNSVIKLVD